MQAKAAKIKMPSPEENMFPKVIGLIPLPVKDLKGIEATLARMKQEIDAWESKFHVSNMERV